MSKRKDRPLTVSEERERARRRGAQYRPYGTDIYRQPCGGGYRIMRKGRDKRFD